jgi:hypothetical protein
MMSSELMQLKKREVNFRIECIEVNDSNKIEHMKANSNMEKAAVNVKWSINKSKLNCTL